MSVFSKSKEIERLKNNLKVMQERNKDLYERDVKHQEQYLEYLHKKDEEITKLKIDLEDTQAFLKQEKELTAALRFERENLKKKINKLELEVAKSGN